MSDDPFDHLRRAGAAASRTRPTIPPAVALVDATSVDEFKTAMRDQMRRLDAKESSASVYNLVREYIAIRYKTTLTIAYDTRDLIEPGTLSRVVLDGIHHDVLDPWHDGRPPDNVDVTPRWEIERFIDARQGRELSEEDAVDLQNAFRLFRYNATYKFGQWDVSHVYLKDYVATVAKAKAAFPGFELFDNEDDAFQNDMQRALAALEIDIESKPNQAYLFQPKVQALRPLISGELGHADGVGF